MKLPKLNYKKVLLFVGFIVTAIFFGWLIIMMIFGTPTVTEPNINDEFYDADGILRRPPTINDRGLGRIVNNINEEIVSDGLDIDEEEERNIRDVEKMTEDAIIGATLDPSNNNVTFYNREDGKFYTIDKNGELKTMSDQAFYSVTDVTWSDNNDKAVIEYPDGSNIIYNFYTKKQTTLPDDWDDFTFSVDNGKVITKSFDPNPDKNMLIVADINTGNTRVLEKIGEKSNNFQISTSPDNQIVAFFTESASFNTQEIYPIGQNDENFNSFIIEGQGFQGIWSPKGDKILYSAYNADDNYEPVLWMTDRSGTINRRANVNTWAEKCTFYNNDIVYCGVPQKLEEMMGLSPSFAIEVNDDIYRIDLVKNYIEEINIPISMFNVKDMIVTENEKELYFTDRRSGRLYKVDL